MVSASEAPVSHDGSYKHLFSHPEMVASLIRDFVPEEWVRELDFSTLERQNGSYVADDLRERHDDIIWRIRCGDSRFFIYLLIEFQSSVDPWMAVRIMTYIGLLYQYLIKSGQVKGEDLPLNRAFVVWIRRILLNRMMPQAVDRCGCEAPTWKRL